MRHTFALNNSMMMAMMRMFSMCMMMRAQKCSSPSFTAI